MKSIIPLQWGNKYAAPARDNDWLNRWWEDPFSSFFPALHSSFSSTLPSVDVTEDKKEVKVKVEIPGLNEKDINVTWHNGVLSIRGEKKDEKEEKGKNRYYRECRYGSFYRNINLGNNVDWKNTKAKYKNGVLSLSLPKTITAQKTIDIKVN